MAGVCSEVPEIAEEIIHVLSVNETENESPIPKTVENGDDSEYETLDEEDASNGSQRSSRSDVEGDVLGELGSDSASIIIEDERVEGDGEEESEQSKDRKLDDDEDRRNPQYIPKKGTFYEHDDRTLVDGEETGVEEKEVGPDGDGLVSSKKEEEQETAKPKKTTGTPSSKSGGGKVWVDKSAQKWQHDMYDEEQQKPKSTQELIDAYGYDIRNEESPPKARRRRRYGRGPNKYTRNWEDEDAYKSASLISAFRGRGRGSSRGTGRGGGRSSNEVDPPVPTNTEEFPELGKERPRQSVSPRKPRYSSERQSTHTKTTVSYPIKKIPKHLNSRPKSIDRNLNHSNEHRNSNNNHSVINGTPEDRSKNNNFISSSAHGSGYTRGSRGGRSRTRGGAGAGSGPGNNDIPFIGNLKGLSDTSSSRGRGRNLLPSFSSIGKSSVHSHLTLPPNVNSKLPPVASLAQKFDHLEISSCSYPPPPVPENGRPITKDGGVERKMTELPPRMQDNSSMNVSRSKRYSAQRQRSLPETTYGPSPANPPPQTQPQQNHHQQHSMPYYPPQTPQTSLVPEFPPPPVFNETVPPPQIVAFIPPGPPPPPGTTPPFPPPPIINYVPSPTAYHTLPIQPPPAVQQAELYQGQNGITYYSTQTQAALPRPTPPRRVKLAIPIMPPPDQPHKGYRNNEHDAKS